MSLGVSLHYLRGSNPFGGSPPLGLSVSVYRGVFPPSYDEALLYDVDERTFQIPLFALSSLLAFHDWLRRFRISPRMFWGATTLRCRLLLVTSLLIYIPLLLVDPTAFLNLNLMPVEPSHSCFNSNRFKYLSGSSSSMAVNGPTMSNQQEDCSSLPRVCWQNESF